MLGASNKILGMFIWCDTLPIFFLKRSSYGFFTRQRWGKNNPVKRHLGLDFRTMFEFLKLKRMNRIKKARMAFIFDKKSRAR